MQNRTWMELPRGNETFSERRLNSAGYTLDEPQFLNAYFHVHFFPQTHNLQFYRYSIYLSQRYSKAENCVNTARIVIYCVIRMCICIVVFCINMNYNIQLRFLVLIKNLHAFYIQYIYRVSSMYIYIYIYIYTYINLDT